MNLKDFTLSVDVEGGLVLSVPPEVDDDLLSLCSVQE